MAPEVARDVKDQVPVGWSLGADGKSIGVRLRLKDFMSAVGLLNEIALVAEELDHHPDLHLTGWNHLEVRTWSHDVDALTERDLRLAARLDAVFAARGLRPL